VFVYAASLRLTIVAQRNTLGWRAVFVVGPVCRLVRAKHGLHLFGFLQYRRISQREEYVSFFATAHFVRRRWFF
jgi:hypothetical protein